MIRIKSKICLVVLVSFIAINPLLPLFGAKAQAKEISETIAKVSFPTVAIANQQNFSYTPTASGSDACKNYSPILKSSDYQKLLALYLKYTNTSSNAITFDDLFNVGNNSKIILKQSDFKALKALGCMGNITTDQNADINALWRKEANNLRNGGNITVTLDTVACVASLDKNQVINYLSSDKSTLADLIDKSISYLKIDSRILKTLVYLVTPKDQGGAGHWRVKVNRILQTSAKSTESDAIITSLSGSTTTKNCSDTMTAAECGAQSTNTADLSISDQEGQQYDAYLDDLTTKEDDLISQRSLSSHAEGQAIDISELDDIRCTKVVKKNIGTTRTYKQPVKPIKLEWQLTEGYKQSGGSNDFDMMSLLKSMATEPILNLLNSFGNNQIDYSGDLSKADFNDITSVLGQSLLGNVLGSSSTSLNGSSVEETIKNFGGSYFADYLGLPRDIFNSQNIGDLEKIKYAIGRASIEVKAGLPVGSLEGSSLEEIVAKVGMSKLEHEMDLNNNDLKDFVINKNTTFNEYVGRRVIEKELGIAKGLWPENETSFANIGKTIGSLKKTLISTNPNYTDNALKLDLGTTEKFISGTELNSKKFAVAVGENRLNQTLYGLRYFATNNSAYQLPAPTKDNPEIKDTWAGALLGDKDSLKTIGIYTLARIFGDDAQPTISADQSIKEISVTEDGSNKKIAPEQFGQYIYREWLRNNLSKSGGSCTASPEISSSIDFNINQSGQIQLKSADFNGSMPTPFIKQSISYSLTTIDKEGKTSTAAVTKDYVVSESKATDLGLLQFDSNRIFGCNSYNSKAVFKRIGSTILYSTLINKVAGKNQSLQNQIAELNPELNIDNLRETLGFYTDRITRINTLSKKIENNWQSFKTDQAFDTVSDRVGNIVTNFSDLFSNQQQSSQVEKILNLVAHKTGDLDELSSDLEIIRDYKNAAESIASGEIDKINSMISDANEMVKLSSEILAGKQINDIGGIKLNQISASFFDSNSQSSGSGANDIKKLSSSKIAYLIFLLLSDKVSPVDTFIRLGGNIMESNLGLPTNSLYYLIQNYEKRGLRGSDALFEAIGQAKIEAEFAMPTNYFQGKNLIDVQPNFETASSITSLVDEYEIDKVINNYLANNSDVYALNNPSLGPLPSNISDKQSKLKILARMKAEGTPVFGYLVSMAKNKWQKNQEDKFQKYGDVSIGEQTLDDVVENVSQSKFTDGIRSADEDLLFRMGLSGKYSSLTANAVLAWQSTDSRAREIDSALNVKAGSTKSLFTGSNGSYIALGESDKNLLEANLGVNKGSLESYINLINQGLSLSQAPSDNNSTGGFVYNPYAGNDDTCSSGFTVKESYLINESTAANGSYCYYDQTGRHCFLSLEEGARYQSEHSGDKYENILQMIATQLASSYSNKGDAAKLYSKLSDFVNNKSQKFAFGSNKAENDQFLSQIAVNAHVDQMVLSELFSRNNLEAPVANYKKAVGQTEATRILSSSLFDSLGINVSTNYFNASDFYKIISGDTSPLQKVASVYIDQSLNLTDGTTFSVLNAKSASARDCAVSKAGGELIGQYLGIENLPLDLKNIGNLGNAIGEQRIENALKLPRGTFKGSSIDEAIKNAGAINIALAFNIPLRDASGSIIVSEADLRAITQNEQLEVNDTTIKSVLLTTKNFLDTNIYLTSAQYEAVKRVNDALVTQLKNSMKSFVIENNALKINLPASASSVQTEYASDVKSFFRKIVYLDQQFGLSNNSIFNLLTAQAGVTPDSINKQIGSKVGATVVGAKVLERLGLNDDQSAAAIELAGNIESVFKCSGTLVDTANGTECRANSATDPLFHNWDSLYALGSRIFKYSLDDKAGLPNGTISKILENPQNADFMAMEYAAGRLDQQFGLTSSSYASFSGLYQSVLKIDTASQNSLKSCFSKASSADGIIPLDLNLQNAQNTLDEVKKSRPAQGNLNDNDYSNSGEFKAWKTKLDSALKTVEDAKKAVSAEINSGYATCKQDIQKSPSGRIDTDAGSNWAAWTKSATQDDLVAWGERAIAEKIHNAIYSITAKQDGKDIRVGVNFPADDLQKFIEGDMRYMAAASISMAANLVTLTAGSISSNNCASGECRQAVPTEMRITYDDVKSALFGTTTGQESKYAAWVDVAGGYANPDKQKVCSSPDCLLTGSGNFGTSLIDQLGQSDQTISNRDITAEMISEQYGFSEANLQKKKDDLAALIVKNPTDNNLITQLDELNNPDKYFDSQGAAFSAKSSLITENVKKAVKKAAANNLQYKVTDAALWKLDENVYAGFTKDMLKGNTEIKTAALAKYLRNGLYNGHLFGKKFSSLPDVDNWAKVAVFIKDLTNNDANAFDKFASGDGFEFLGDYISDSSIEWFGIELNSEMSKGLLVGIGTGDWGITDITLDKISTSNITHEVKLTSGGTTDVPTLGGAMVDFGAQKLFAWADKSLGLENGQAYLMFKDGVAIYNSWRVYDQIKDAKDLAELSGLAKDYVDQNKITSIEEAKTKSDAALGQATSALGQQLTNVLTDKYLGNQVSSWESDLGMANGTLMPLVSTIAYNVVTVPVVNAAGYAAFGSSFAPFALNPASLAIVAVVAAVGYLMGEKVYYYCNADGYYPVAETAQENLDQSGLGVWGGKANDASLSTQIKENSIKAAQYKANRLIGDMLEIQNSAKFKDANDAGIIPIQIMTGRNEDVAAYDNIGMITTNVCQAKLGADSVSCGGVCGSANGNTCTSNTRMGIWQNPQTIAWTHIGF